MKNVNINLFEGISQDIPSTSVDVVLMSFIGNFEQMR